MARPKKEGMDYFPHDTDAVNDEKIEALRMLYGNDGYAFYFILLERIYRSPKFELDVSDAETIQILSKKVGVNEEVFHKILQTALKRGCFDKELYEEKGVLTSDGVKKRANVVVEKRVKMREKYSKDKEEGVSDAETTQETGEESTQSKVKESKEKKSKGKESKEKKLISPKFDTCDIEMANQLFSRILENNENAKEPDLEKWANEIRLMRISDNRTEEQIRYLIDWTQSDSFWKSNILSPAKLRKQFDALAIRVKEDIRKQNKVAQIQDRKPKAYQSLEDWADEA